MEIDYVNFEKDLDNTISSYLNKYDFTKKSKNDIEFELLFKNDFWSIEISMMKHFPYISVSFSFYSLSDDFCNPNILDLLLGVKQKEISKHYSDFKSRIGFDDYRKEMIYICESLDRFYKPLLTGEKKYSDYLKLKDETIS